MFEIGQRVRTTNKYNLRNNEYFEGKITNIESVCGNHYFITIKIFCDKTKVFLDDDLELVYLSDPCKFKLSDYVKTGNYYVSGAGECY